MTASTLGPRLIAALVPKHFKDLHAIHFATRIAYSTIHAWKKGSREPKWSQVEEIARQLGTDPFQLLVGSAGAASTPKARVCDHPDWKRAYPAALANRPSRLSPGAYVLAASTSGAGVPEHLSWEWVYDLARFWHDHATDDQLATAETEAAELEMAAEDAAIEAAKPKAVKR